jgi:SAM-dependent methyltransferase
VIATDASREQIQFAIPHEKVEYRVEPAEGTTIEAHSADLITVGVAIHWFEFDPFYVEVRRVAKPGAVIGVWTYDYPSIFPAVNLIIDRYNRETLEGYWPERIHYLTEHYATLPFPFEPISPPEFTMHTEWDLTELIGFIRSWSATQHYLAENGPHSLDMTWMDLEQAWGDPQTTHSIRWPLYLRVGKVN